VKVDLAGFYIKRPVFDANRARAFAVRARLLLAQSQCLALNERVENALS
jgi:hypothetical protein